MDKTKFEKANEIDREIKEMQRYIGLNQQYKLTNQDVIRRFAVLADASDKKTVLDIIEKTFKTRLERFQKEFDEL